MPAPRIWRPFLPLLHAMNRSRRSGDGIMQRLGRANKTSPKRRPAGSSLVANLSAVAQEVVGEHNGHHGLAHGHGANADAGVVPALGGDFGLVAERVDGAPRGEDR